MDLIHKIESLRYDIENGIETDVIKISVRLIQIKDQALQLLQTGVIDSCSNTYIGKEFVYTSRITNCKTIFKVARTDDRYGQTILISENKNRYFLGDVIPHN